jgi:alpha-beta hydrolase superfamily lysophospholipase
MDSVGTIRVDVSDVAMLGEPCWLEGSLFIPDAVPEDPTLVVAIPGGTYTRDYWNLEVPGRDDSYSFARSMTSAGFLVATLDNLGTGASARPAAVDQLTFDVVAAANAGFVQALVTMLGTGDASPSLGPQPHVRLVGVGHSLGGQLLAVQQGIHHTFERIAILGSSFIGNVGTGTTVGDDGAFDAAMDNLRGMAGPSWDDGYLVVARELLRSQFHAADVPADVLAADDATATVLPRQLGGRAVAPSAYLPVVAAIDVPTFLAFADVDMSPDPFAEVASYSGAPEVTLFRLPGSAHCHNQATTRHVLWSRLADWIDHPRPTKS